MTITKIIGKVIVVSGTMQRSITRTISPSTKRRGISPMSEFNLGIFLFALFSGVIIVAWITIDDEDFNERFEHNRKMRFEDEEK